MMIQAFVEGELGHFLNAQSKAVGVGGGRAMRITTGAIRKKIAGNIRRAGFAGGGKGLARAVRSRVAGKGANVEGVVYSKAIYSAGRMRPGGPVDLVQLFAQGATIRAASGDLVGDPDRVRAGRRRPRRQAAGEPGRDAGDGDQAGVSAVRPDRAVAVRRDGGRSVVTHVLVRQVILRKRFDIESVVNRYVAQFPEILAREINGAAESSRVLQRYGG